MSPPVTPHFTVAEFDCHDGTDYPIEWVEERLLPLCQALETIRATIGRPVRVLSGYRTPAYNRRKGSSPTSQHPQGRAADIAVRGMAAAELHRIILDMHTRGLLPTIGGLGAYPTFVHVDVRPRPASGRLARWRGGRAAAEV